MLFKVTYVNHCVTLAIEYLGNREMAYAESDGHVTDDVTWPERSSRDLKSNIAKTGEQQSLITIGSLLYVRHYDRLS